MAEESQTKVPQTEETKEQNDWRTARREEAREMAKSLGLSEADIKAMEEGVK